jgi:hypothetical protein
MERGPKEGHGKGDRKRVMEKGTERGSWKRDRKRAMERGPRVGRTKERALSQRWPHIHIGIFTLKLGAFPTKSSGFREVLVGQGQLLHACQESKQPPPLFTMVSYHYALPQLDRFLFLANSSSM